MIVTLRSLTLRTCWMCACIVHDEQACLPRTFADFAAGLWGTHCVDYFGGF
jgi:hypothetical protein